MAVDRLAALRGGGGGGNPFATADSENTANPFAVAPAAPQRRQSEKFMPQFFSQVEVVNGGIREIKEATARIKEITEQATFAASGAAEKELSEQLQPTLDRANREAQQSSKLLKQIKAETKAMHKDMAKDADIANQVKVRENLHGTLVRKFVDVIKAYQDAQTKYRADIKKKVSRQVKHVVPDATDEQIDGLIRTGDTGQVYQNAILDGAADPIQEVYTAASEKLADVQRLERSVRELTQMFQDMALLVEQQGEMLDQIEYQVKQARGHVQKGNVELVQALKHQTSLRKKKCCMLVFLLGGIAIFCGVIFAMS
jgi:t-SNARE complex subunit (syntaxin)